MMEALKHAETLVSAKLSAIKTVFTIMQLEARLAGLSIFPLIVNICMLVVISITFWFLLCAGLSYGIFFFSHSIPLALLLVFIFNLLLFACLIKYLFFNIKNMSFEKTRAYFSKDMDDKNEQLKKTLKGANRITE